MKNKTTENTLIKVTTVKGGTYVYALYSKGAVVYVGQCTDLHSRIDTHSADQEIQFERFTYTFLEGAKLNSEFSNLIEAVAVSRLMPFLPKKMDKLEITASGMKVQEERITLCATGRIVYKLLKRGNRKQKKGAVLPTVKTKMYGISSAQRIAS